MRGAAVPVQFHRLEDCCRIQEGMRRFATESGGAPREPPDVDRVPPIPSQEQHICDWLSSRNSRLRNVLEFGDYRTVSKLSSLLAEGCGRLASLGATESMDTISVQDRFDGSIDHRWGCEAPLSSWEGSISFHSWKPGELRESCAVCNIHLGDVIKVLQGQWMKSCSMISMICRERFQEECGEGHGQ